MIQRDSSVREAIWQLLLPFIEDPPEGPADEADVFDVYGLNSIDVFKVAVSVEQRFGIVVGDDPSDFDSLRTLSGWCALVRGKLQHSVNKLPGGDDA